VTDRLFPVQQEQLTSDDYYTPRWVFERMAIRFDLDVCSPPGGVEWVPADRYYDQADDGLASPWEGRVWMNPPYSRPTPWVARFIEHGNGVALVPFAKSAWFDLLWSRADAVVAPGVQASKFVGGPIFMPVFLAAFGDECVEAIGRLGVVRTRPTESNGA
jgi:hypothetical protein